MRGKQNAAVLLIVTALVRPAVAEEEAAAEARTYSEMSLEDLLRVKITSVAGVAASWFQSPAAIAVFTSEDVRRQGFQSIADAFRAVPGMQVGRLDSRQWAISARGFNGLFANKLLALQDGRTIYDPRSAGVYWDIRDVLLEDLDRVEVIRGPGATLWGANAVNGVINITTKSAKYTQGLYVSTLGGTEERAFAGVRYGGRIGASTYYRVWGSHRERDSFVESATGADGPDDWNISRGGLRFDIERSPTSSLQLNGELYGSSRLGMAVRTPVPGRHLTYTTIEEDGAAHGGHVLAHFKTGEGEASGWDVRAYFDRDNRVIYIGTRPRSDSFDVDVRRHFNLGSRNVMLVGAGWRRTSDSIARGPFTTAFLNHTRIASTFQTYSGFVQDTIALPGKLSLMVGSKFEDHDLSGFDFQPSGRLSWTPTDNHTVWAAVSRPVRTPSRAELHVDLTVAYVDAGLAQGRRPLGVFVPLKVSGNPDARSERLTAYEAGYRARLGDRVSVDVAAYKFEYRDVLSGPTTGFGRYDNFVTAHSRGLEIAATVRASNALRLDTTYTYTHITGERSDAPRGTSQDSPHIASLRAHWDVRRNLELNGGLYFTDAVKATTPPVRSHTRADLGLTWRPMHALEIAVWGQDLLDARHQEYPVTFQPGRSEAQRGAYVQVTVRK